jgi:hypothetical protein
MLSDKEALWHEKMATNETDVDTVSAASVGEKKAPAPEIRWSTEDEVLKKIDFSKPGYSDWADIQTDKFLNKLGLEPAQLKQAEKPKAPRSPT